MKTYLSLVLVILMIFSLCAVVSAEDPVVNSDYVLETNSPTTGASEIELSLKNESGQEITVSGPVDLGVTLDGPHYSVEWGRVALSGEAGDVFLGEGDSIDIPAGESEVIAVIAPDLPDTWRPFELADHDMIISAWVKIDGVDHHLEAVAHTVEPRWAGYDLELSSNTPTEYVEDAYMPMILSLTNHSDKDITVTGDVVVDGAGDWKNRDRFSLIGGESMVIPTGQTVEVVEIEPGPPISWRNFYFPQVNHVTVWFQLDGEFGPGMWVSEAFYGIIGEVPGENYNGTAEFVQDNEDGTATVKVTLVEFSGGEWGVTYENGLYDFYQTEYQVVGPATGFTRENFVVSRELSQGMQEPVGTLVGCVETAPGEYLLTWAHDDGTHNIFLEFDIPETGDHAYLDAVVDEGLSFNVIVSTQNRPVVSELDEETGKYTGVLEYPTASITFTSDEEIDAQINYRRKGETDKAPPAGGNPTGIYLDVNVASGDLEDAAILLEVKYTRDDIPEGMNENDLKLFRYNEDTGEWELIPEQEVDTGQQLIRAWLEGFSEFGVFEYADEAVDEENGEPAEGAVEEDEDDDELPETGTMMNHLIPMGLFLCLLGAGMLLRRRPSTV